MRRTRSLLAASAVAGALLLTGCGVEERIVHLQPAPTENSAAGAPLRTEAAEQITARVLAQAAEATNEEERQAVLIGPALRIAEARAAEGGAATAQADVFVPAAPTILAMSSGQDWPRAILAASLDEETQVQSLHVLVSTGPADLYRLHATAPMLAGSSVPSLGELPEGTDFEFATEEAPTDDAAVVDEYAQGLAFPTPGETTLVTLEDEYAQSLRRNADAQAEAFGDLAELTQTHAPIIDSVVSVQTEGGGRVIFAQMTRTTSIELSEDAKELKIEDPTLRELSGKEVVTSGFSTEFLENLVLIVPADTPGQLIGAEEVVLRAEGS
jgi:hypothetical protein